MYIGPGNQDYRAKLIEFFKKESTFFKLAPRLFGKKWHAVYQKEFLRKKDYEEATIDDLTEIIDRRLSEFMSEDLLKINDFFGKKWKTKG